MTEGIDYSDLRALQRDLGEASAKVTRNSQKAVQRTAHLIMEDAKGLIAGIPHAPYYPGSITYDMVYGLQQIGAEIGPDKERTQGALGNILEYGTRFNSPRPHLGPALLNNEQDFFDGLRKAADFL